MPGQNTARSRQRSHAGIYNQCVHVHWFEVKLCMSSHVYAYKTVYICDIYIYHIRIYVHVCVCLLASAKSSKSPKSKQLLQKKVYSARRLQKFGSVHGAPLGSLKCCNPQQNGPMWLSQLFLMISWMSSPYSAKVPTTLYSIVLYRILSYGIVSIV